MGESFSSAQRFRNVTFQPPIPLFRIFDRKLALAFYVDWLGFTVEWEHQFTPESPHYLQVSRGALVLHLTEHYGDCSPGAKILVNTDDVQGLYMELSSRPNPFMSPEVEMAPWNARTLTVTDPFGNRICFNEPLPPG